MIIIEKEYINNIPLLHVVKKGEEQHNVPFILFIHGITSAKEHNLHYAFLLAEKGFRVILPEAIYHGEREENHTQEVLSSYFWKIVLNTIQEIKTIVYHYVLKGLADQERIGLAGTSMGGIATLGALTQYPWVKAAVSLMGMPAYEQFTIWQLDLLRKQGHSIPLTEEQIEEQLTIVRDFDLSQHPEKLDNRPLLFWHAKNDPIVPYTLTFQFFESIKGNYHMNPDRLKFISDENAGHKVSRAGLKATVEWFEKYL